MKDNKKIQKNELKQKKKRIIVKNQTFNKYELHNN